MSCTGLAIFDMITGAAVWSLILAIIYASGSLLLDSIQREIKKEIEKMEESS